MLKVFLIILFVIVSSGAFFLIRKNLEAREREIISLANVDQVKSKLGKPFYTYTTFPPQFGASMVCPDDFKNGIIVETYMFQKYPPRFLVIKRHKESNKILASIIESS